MYKETRFVRLWSFINVKMLWFMKPSVVELDDEHVVVRVPLNWRTRRKDIKAMYFGALCSGADCAGGLMAMRLIQNRGKSVSMIFKDFKADFLKRAEGDVHFTCRDGSAIRQLVDKAIESGVREEQQVHIVATVPSKLGDEPVAKFDLTLSLKRRS